MPETLFTIGHSTHPIGEFIEILSAHGVLVLADVRTIPKSRHNPQFDAQTLTDSLKQAGIHYIHLEGLGGLRRPKKDSVNKGWRNDSFRGFADYMQTGEFEKGLSELLARAEGQPTVIMCAESLPWRCHRSLIADALTVRGVKVLHIMGKTPVKEHALTPWAVVDGTRITYPREQSEMNLGKRDKTR